MTKQVLKIKIHQPNAHYRLPFSYKRRFTYPIPPYSTVKGLICNVMGIDDDKSVKFRSLLQGLSLAVHGTFESMVKEYIWFRNLQKESHVSKFKSETNRIIDNIPEHPGGQIPVITDTLHNVDLILYIYHPELIDEIKSAFENPINRRSVLHLGRAEDWIVINEIQKINVDMEGIRQIRLFTWLPSPSYVDDEFVTSKEDYEKFFKQVRGNIFRLPTFYEIDETNKRVFKKHIEVKLIERVYFEKQKFYIDASDEIPMLFTKMRYTI